MLSKKYSWISEGIQDSCKLQGKTAPLAQARSALFKLPVTHLLSQSRMASAPLLHALFLQGRKFWELIVNQVKETARAEVVWWEQGWEQHTGSAQKGSAGFWEPLRNHRCTRAQNDLGWKGPQLSPDQVAQSIIQPDLNTSNDGAPIASMFQCLTTPTVPGVVPGGHWSQETW